MAQDLKPISHQTLNELPQSSRVRYFRRMLISSGTLPDIDVRLNDLELRTRTLIGMDAWLGPEKLASSDEAEALVEQVRN